MGGHASVLAALQQYQDNRRIRLVLAAGTNASRGDAASFGHTQMNVHLHMTCEKYHRFISINEALLGAIHLSKKYQLLARKIPGGPGRPHCADVIMQSGICHLSYGPQVCYVIASGSCRRR